MLERDPKKFSALGNFASLQDLDDEINKIVDAINELNRAKLSAIDVVRDIEQVQDIPSYYCIGENGHLVQMPLFISNLLSQEAYGSAITVSSNMIAPEAITSSLLSNGCITTRNLTPGCLESQHFADRCLDSTSFEQIPIDGQLISRIRNLTTENFSPNSIPIECVPTFTLEHIDASFILPNIATLNIDQWKQIVQEEKEINSLKDIMPLINDEYNNYLTQHPYYIISIYLSLQNQEQTNNLLQLMTTEANHCEYYIDATGSLELIIRNNLNALSQLSIEFFDYISNPRVKIQAISDSDEQENQEENQENDEEE